MSANHTVGHETHGHGDHDVHAAHGSLKGYLIGFGLSVVLTAIPFWLVMTGSVSPGWTAAIIIALAVVQILVHMVFFLHLDAKSEGGWNLLAAIFTIVIVVITLAGSLWVMYHMNQNMMPHMAPPTEAAAQGEMSGM
ncbi:cytochrome o ubiquinol oxidase subunit IV [Sphingomonas sp. MMS12-HWE2-04]|uniref:cytochrome o ubiquinol oxidase subunit IV n=1 Tax=Sphingomonas sp. MMS12-HWE2-04 TaxID=3234199 RepID=UPI00384E4CD2